jgi:hypothetical protein
MMLLAAITVSAQHSVTLTNGDILKGKITDIQPRYITIVDSIHKTDCPVDQVSSYNAGYGTILVNTNTIKNINGYSASILNIAGDELIKSSKVYYTGFAITIVGVGITALGASKSSADSNAMVYVGGGIAFVGVIISVIAFSHIGKAGRMLNAISTKDGIGISLNF